MLMTVGITSLEDWPRLTWSFGCTGFFAPSGAPRISLALLAITSLAFMFHDVPDPVWKTSIGKWASHFPCAISSAACSIARAMGASRRPSAPFTDAAACFTCPSARTRDTGIRSSETEKFSTARCVWAPQ